VFPDPVAVRTVLRLGEGLVERDGGSYERIGACASCAVRAVCPGPVRAIAARVARVAAPLEHGEGIVPIGRERARVLREYRSLFHLAAPDGTVCERRIVRVNFHCNQACDFCFVSRELPPVEHELVVKEIREAAERNAVLDLSGGEPTLNPRLTEYIALARELGVREIELQTNAIKMADAAYARALWDAGLRQAFVSLHGTTAAVSDRVTAAPATFDKTVEGVRNLLTLGMEVRLNYVLCGYNVHELAGFADYVRRAFLDPTKGARLDINFSFVAASTDNVPRDTGLIPRFSDVAWALAALHDRTAALGIRLTGFDSKCGVPACYLPRAIRDQHFASDLPDEERAAASAGFVRSDACGRCELEKRCYGIRASYAELYGTGELRPVVGGEVLEPPAPPAAQPAFRGSVWEAIGLSPGHRLSPESLARAKDDAFFRAAADPWVQREGRAVDREVAQLQAGLREVMKVERGSAVEAERAAANLADQGFVARVYVGPAGPGGSSARAIAFAGRSAARVDEAIDIEPGLVASFRERQPLVRRMGALLGYPPCCVDAFATSAEQDDATHVARLTRAHAAALLPEQNWAVAPLRLFSHFPCSPTCAATTHLARATLDVMEHLNAGYRAAVERALRSVVLIGSVDRFASLEGATADGPGAFTYAGVLSHRNLGMDDAVLARPTFRAFYLEVIARLEEGTRIVRSPSSLLVEREGRKIAEIRFAGEPPPLLDFTGRHLRKLPVVRAAV
jgi:hypothetical protein